MEKRTVQQPTCDKCGDPIEQSTGGPGRPRSRFCCRDCYVAFNKEINHREIKAAYNQGYQEFDSQAWECDFIPARRVLMSDPSGRMINKKFAPYNRIGTISDRDITNIIEKRQEEITMTEMKTSKKKLEKDIKALKKEKKELLKETAVLASDLTKREPTKDELKAFMERFKMGSRDWSHYFLNATSYFGVILARQNSEIINLLKEISDENKKKIKPGKE